jgi:hypothetical protein
LKLAGETREQSVAAGGDGSSDLRACAEPKSGILWFKPRSKEKVMQPSTDDLLIRQISALISATADAASTSREHAPFMEARLYETLAAHCAEKQRVAAFARSGFTTARRGLIYW